MKRFALIGLPNTGKSTLFNRLTGMSQRVGNWPGLTVDLTSARVAGWQHGGAGGFARRQRPDRLYR
jgi:Fe2+ transport system protein B